MKTLNLSGITLQLPFDPEKLEGLNQLIIYPNYSHSEGLFPTGSLAVFKEEGHSINSEYAGPDIGHGMILGRFLAPIVDLEDSTNGIASRILSNYAKTVGDLGGYNDFVTLYKISRSENQSFKTNDEMVLIHAGSRQRGLVSCQL